MKTTRKLSLIIISLINILSFVGYSQMGGVVFTPPSTTNSNSYPKFRLEKPSYSYPGESQLSQKRNQDIDLCNSIAEVLGEIFEGRISSYARSKSISSVDVPNIYLPADMTAVIDEAFKYLGIKPNSIWGTKIDATNGKVAKSFKIGNNFVCIDIIRELDENARKIIIEIRVL